MKWIEEIKEMPTCCKDYCRHSCGEDYKHKPTLLKALDIALEAIDRTRANDCMCLDEKDNCAVCVLNEAVKQIEELGGGGVCPECENAYQSSENGLFCQCKGGEDE